MPDKDKITMHIISKILTGWVKKITHHENSLTICVVGTTNIFALRELPFLVLLPYFKYLFNPHLLE